MFNASLTRAWLLTLLAFTSDIWAVQNKLSIRSVFDIKSAFCAIKTNDVLGLDNRNSALAGRGFGTASTNSMLLLENGINDISLELGSVNWFVNDNRQKKEDFNPQASCHVSLIAYENGKSTTLQTLEVAINSDGEPYDKNGSVKGHQQSTAKVEKVLANDTEKGHFPDDYYNEHEYPKDMYVYRFTKAVKISGVPEWKWTKATPFTGSQEQIEALKEAYLKLWKAFASKDDNTVKAQLYESLNAWGLSTNTSPQEIYNDYEFTVHFKKDSFKMIPINWMDYRIEVMNKGRMVRFVNKSIPAFSPLTYLIKDDQNEEEIYYYAPIFSMVDGKFIPVI